MLMVKTFLANGTVQGVALYAAEDIRKGTVVWKYHPGFDNRFPWSEVRKLPQSARAQILRYGYYSDGNIVLCADDARFTSHSVAPNVTWVDDGTEEGMTVAARDIPSGEEITSDLHGNKPEVSGLLYNITHPLEADRPCGKPVSQKLTPVAAR